MALLSEVVCAPEVCSRLRRLRKTNPQAYLGFLLCLFLRQDLTVELRLALAYLSAPASLVLGLHTTARVTL